ncbi:MULTISPECIES: AraC family transcriptional regulator [unclassified Imperialibacter]|uniref:helix-turn-helix domain-containing protein n=1 Tax=unclassified Imperialibacter TaxID=2629706 RepID=UPI00125113C6|nr:MULTISPECIES: helix-turn-helix domain-containing protein [unclassified Imperialibacter]CAD5264782.1 AraC-type DNA-binding protein [Imperialibacter sp. 89]CAD5269660.1 AraC-type DNA-binding protein [Imperialibacter sp. 75]VVT09285.1 AraC-type DNA-binding protein [Imperialibacter sp. EC-SDR9]
MEQFTEINIKGMVCNRCIFTIKELLQSHGYPVEHVALGKVIFAKPVDNTEKGSVKDLLSLLGFALITDKNEKLLSQIKQSIEEWLSKNGDGARTAKLSSYLSGQLGKNYDSLSEFFVTHEGNTIERYVIALRIEKVKELLVYTDLSLSEIAFKTGFSSAHHLSFQFKKTTGLNTSAYKPLRSVKLKAREAMETM